jgi:hypothetical protein
MRPTDAGEQLQYIIVTELKYLIRYRNFMMACTSLYEQDVMPQYFSLLEEDGGPSFRKCQEWIERAWSEGTSLFLV